MGFLIGRWEKSKRECFHTKSYGITKNASDKRHRAVSSLFLRATISLWKIFLKEKNVQILVCTNKKSWKLYVCQEIHLISIKDTFSIFVLLDIISKYHFNYHFKWYRWHIFQHLVQMSPLSYSIQKSWWIFSGRYIFLKLS